MVDQSNLIHDDGPLPISNESKNSNQSLIGSFPEAITPTFAKT